MTERSRVSTGSSGSSGSCAGFRGWVSQLYEPNLPTLDPAALKSLIKCLNVIGSNWLKFPCFFFGIVDAHDALYSGNPKPNWLKHAHDAHSGNPTPNWLKHAHMLGSSFCLEVSVRSILSGEICTSAAAAVRPCWVTLLRTLLCAFFFVHLFVLWLEDTTSLFSNDLYILK